MSIQNNLKIRDNSCYDPRVSRLCSSFGNFYGSEVRHGIFGGVKFWSRDFFEFVLSPRDFFGVLIFAPIRSSLSLEN